MKQRAPTRSITPRLQILPILAVAFLATVSRSPAQDKLLRWHDGLARGVEAARSSGKPLFVVFRCVR